jgi:hypothetical protein
VNDLLQVKYILFFGSYWRFKKKGVMYPIELLRIEISIATPVGQIIQLAGG